MKKVEIVEYLKKIMSILNSYTGTEGENSLRWNGHSYAKSCNSKTFDPYALCWFATLSTICDFLEMQQENISENQKVYLSKILFGGMGSLNDFAIDEAKCGEKASAANQALHENLAELYKLFKK